MFKNPIPKESRQYLIDIIDSENRTRMEAYNREGTFQDSPSGRSGSGGDSSPQSRSPSRGGAVGFSEGEPPSSVAEGSVGSISRSNSESSLNRAGNIAASGVAGIG